MDDRRNIMRPLHRYLTMLLLLPGLAAAAAQWVGTPAPTLRLPDQDGVLRAVQDYRGHWVTLYFYPKDKTPGCTEEAKQFRDHWAEFQKAGIVVLGVSEDTVASHKAFAGSLHLPFPILADDGHVMAKAMGVLRGFGPLTFASRQTFLVDPEGTIVYHYADVDTGRHAAQVLADVARLSKSP
jgi:peroxiredoxin Q/BCP